MLLYEIKNDEKFFDDLSKIMKYFKKSLDLLTKLSTQILTELYTNSNYLDFAEDNYQKNQKLLAELQNQIKQIIQYFQTISNHYKEDQYFYQIRQTHSATLNRFSCRIIQTLSYNKMKTITNIGQSPFKIFIDQIFPIINNFRTDLNFALFLKKITILLKKVSKKFPSRFNETIANHSAIEGEDQQRIHHHQGSNRQKSPKKVKPTTQIKINKIMETFKKSYSNFSVMDIQYAHYRNTFFQSKSSTSNQQLLEDCLYRNRFIMSQITLYNKKFCQYKNRQNSPTRRTKLLNTSYNNSKFQAKNSKNTSPQHQQVKKFKKQIFNMTKNGSYRYSNKIALATYNYHKLKTQSPPVQRISQEFNENFDDIIYESPKMKTIQKKIINLNQSKDIFLKTNNYNSSGYQFMVGKTFTSNLYSINHHKNNHIKTLQNENNDKTQDYISQSLNKKKIKMNQVLISGNKLRLAPIRVQNKQTIESINEKKRKTQILLKSQKEKILAKGPYMSVGHVNNTIAKMKLNSHTNIFKLKNNRTSIHQAC